MLAKHLTEADRDAVLAHYVQLSDSDRHLRFGYCPKEEGLKRYVDNIDFERDVLYGVFGREIELIAVSHLAISETRPSVAEFGVSVCAQHRCTGIGRSLMERSIEHASNSGIHRMVVQTLAHNKPMLTLMLGYPHEFERDGCERIATLGIESGNAFSHWHELSLDRMAGIRYLVDKTHQDIRHLWQSIRHYRRHGSIHPSSS